MVRRTGAEPLESRLLLPVREGAGVQRQSPRQCSGLFVVAMARLRSVVGLSRLVSDGFSSEFCLLPFCLETDGVPLDRRRFRRLCLHLRTAGIRAGIAYSTNLP